MFANGPVSMSPESIDSLHGERNAQASRRLRVLICAHEFSPTRGSECAVGWNIARGLAKFHDVTVLAASGSQKDPYCYREAYDRYHLSNRLVAGLDVRFIDQTVLSRRCVRFNLALTGMADGVGFRPLFYAGLRDWQRAAYKVGEQIGFDSFDVIHQLTPIAFRTPGFLWQSGRPFILGPISGMYSVPMSYAYWLGARSCAFEAVRHLVNVVQARLVPGIREAIRSAALVWTVTDADADLVRHLGGAEPRRMLEAGTSTDSPVARSYEGDRPIRICWSGRLDAAKALPLLLQAIAGSQLRDRIHLTVLGSGPMHDTWKATARNLGLSGILWKGWLAHNEALAEIDRHDLLVHTSIREGTPNVVLESLTLGVPVICHDTCGMAIAVNESCGVKVSLISPEESVRGFRDAIEKFIGTPGLVGDLSAGAIKRAAELTWDAKAREMAEAYTSIANGVELRDRNFQH